MKNHQIYKRRTMFLKIFLLILFCWLYVNKAEARPARKRSQREVDDLNEYEDIQEPVPRIVKSEKIKEPKQSLSSQKGRSTRGSQVWYNGRLGRDLRIFSLNMKGKNDGPGNEWYNGRLGREIAAKDEDEREKELLLLSSALKDPKVIAGLAKKSKVMMLLFMKG